MEYFLEKVAQTLLEEHGEQVGHLLVVLPNRRAGLFLKKHLIRIAGKNLFAPRILSISDFIEELCPLEVADNITLLFELYHVYKEIEGDAAESFDHFSKWGPVLLNDFNEINSYLLDDQLVYANLRQIKSIENWSLGAEDLTENQENYLAFYHKLPAFYERFCARLLHQQKCFPGYAYRWVAENLQTLLPEMHSQKVYFVGFNALSTAEQRILSGMCHAQKARLFWDADRYYLRQHKHEAGTFLRQYQKNQNLPFEWIGNDFATSEKNIHIIGVPGHAGQAKLAGDLLANQIPEKQQQNTALVLAEEALLLPVLNALPKAVEKVNVTMGYPLKNTPMQSLFDAIFTLHENVSRMGQQRHGAKFYHNDVIKLFHHPYVKRMMERKGQRNVSDCITAEIMERNKVFLSMEEMDAFFDDPDISTLLDRVRYLFKPLLRVPQDVLEMLFLTTDQLRIFLITTRKKTHLELEYVFHYTRILKRLQALSDQYAFFSGLHGFRSLFQQITAASSLDFYGEPLQGLQIMGLLETRALDFENVILLSVNENTLPGAKADSSFIPYDLRKHFKLPAYTEKDAVYAYHFYRLIQRAKNVWLIYNTQTDDFGSGERSRFIAQLLHELPKINPKIKMDQQVLATPVKVHRPKEFEVPKDQTAHARLNLLFAGGLSPTALTTFVNCPLDFYYKYILSLREANAVEETIEASSFGVFVHQTLEQLYQPFTGQFIRADDVQQMVPKVAATLEAAFEGLYSDDEMRYGKNFLAYRVALGFIERFLDREIHFLEALEVQGESLKILALEEKLLTELTVETKSGTQKVCIRGNADRIDQVGGITRIIDYKTGRVKANDLKLATTAEITHDIKFQKPFQILMYALMYRKNFPEDQGRLQSGILSFRALEEGLINAEIDGEHLLTPQHLNDFEAELHQLIRRIADPDVPFRHVPDSTWCTFC